MLPGAGFGFPSQDFPILIYVTISCLQKHLLTWTVNSLRTVTVSRHVCIPLSNQHRFAQNCPRTSVHWMKTLCSLTERKAYVPKVSFTAIRVGKQPTAQPGLGTVQEPWRASSYLFVFSSPLPVMHLNWLRCQGSDGLSLPSAYGHLSCQAVNGSRSREPGMEPTQETSIQTEHEGHDSNEVGQKSLNK